MRGRSLAVLSGFLMLATGCAGCSKPAGASAAIERPISVTRWVLVLDPTTDKHQAIDEVVEALPSWVRANDELTVRFVQAQAVAKGEPIVKRYHLDRTDKSWKETHEKKVAKDAEEILKKFTELSTDFHAPENVHEPKSCIVTALAEASRYIAKASTTQPTRLVVVSDLLEVCSEWGNVNLERRFAQTDSLFAGTNPFRFPDVDQASFLRVSSRVVTTSWDQTKIEQLWLQAAGGMGIPRERIWFGETFDQLSDRLKATHP